MKNRYEDNGDGSYTMYCNIYGREFPVLFSSEDFRKVKAFPNTWSISFNASSKTCYIYGRIFKDGKETRIYLHRYIMDTIPGMVVDHINHKGWDNRRSNLRNVTQRDNRLNRRGAFTPVNEVEGLSGILYRQKKIDGETYYFVNFINNIPIGRFKSLREASLVQTVANFFYSGQDENDVKQYYQQFESGIPFSDYTDEEIAQAGKIVRKRIPFNVINSIVQSI